MSIHLLECAANLDLPASTKLALMAFADSADQYTNLALPGLDQVKRWSGLRSDSRAKEVVADLTTRGLLLKHRGGRRGRRAEYVVFPNGCCEQHPPRPGNENVLGNLGSAVPDPSPLGKAAVPDPIDFDQFGSAPPDPNTLNGAGKGPAHRTPSLTKELTPLTPRHVGGNPATPEHPPMADAVARPPCPRHPSGKQPNCRGCRTTPRQVHADETATRRASDRAQTQALIEAERQAKATATSVTAPGVRTLVQSTRQQIRHNRTLSGASTA